MAAVVQCAALTVLVAVVYVGLHLVAGALT